MSDETDCRDTIQIVVKRADLLDRLTRGPARKRDLRDDLGVSRSTVYKAVRELEDRELVAEDGDTVRLTLFGRLFVERYQSFVETMADVDRQRTLLAALPPDAPVTTDLLVEADFVSAERSVPDRPLNTLDEVVEGADELVGFSPVALQRYVDLFHDQLVGDDLCADLVFECDVVEYLRSDYGEKFAASVATDCFTVWETEATLPFGLVVTEDDRPRDERLEGDGSPDGWQEVAVVVYDAEGQPVGTIRNDTPAALEWGRDVFETYRSNAERLEAE